MSPENLEKRVIAIEAEVAELKAKLATVSGEDVPWWKRISGIFADDPAFEEAMRPGGPLPAENWVRFACSIPP